MLGRTTGEIPTIGDKRLCLAFPIPVQLLEGGDMAGMRGWLYRIAKLLGDVNAVKKGRVARRVGRRVAGRVAGKGLGRMFK